MTFSQSDGLLLPIYTSCINFIFSKIQLFFLPSSTAVAHLYFSYTQTVHVAMLGFVLECGEYPKRKYPCTCQVHSPISSVQFRRSIVLCWGQKQVSQHYIL